MRKTAVALVVAAATMTPAAALATTSHAKYHAGEKCTSKHAAAYKKAGFKCTKGKLVKTKKA